ncbi:MAG: hypothetical protein ACK4ND_19455 [Cytophagaceae bacterium]
MEHLIIIVLFVFALVYLGKRIKDGFFYKEKGSCPKGCGCSNIDMAKIEKEINKARTEES